MAKQATKAGGGGAARKTKKTRTKSSSRSRQSSSRDRQGGSTKSADAGEAFIKLLQSPLVADLLAVAATAALATLAEQGFTSRSSGGGSRGKRAGKAVKEAGKAAASAIGRRLGTEFDEIRKSSKAAKGRAKA
jgi:hypothetical protein